MSIATDTQIDRHLTILSIDGGTARMRSLALPLNGTDWDKALTSLLSATKTNDDLHHELVRMGAIAEEASPITLISTTPNFTTNDGIERIGFAANYSHDNCIERISVGPLIRADNSVLGFNMRAYDTAEQKVRVFQMIDGKTICDSHLSLRLNSRGVIMHGMAQRTR